MSASEGTEVNAGIIIASAVALVQVVAFVFAIEPVFDSFGDTGGLIYIVLAIAGVGLSWFGVQLFVASFLKDR